MLDATQRRVGNAVSTVGKRSVQAHSRTTDEAFAERASRRAVIRVNQGRPSLDNSASTLLAGLKVIELQSIGPVPFTGRLLADLGAEVLRIHSPQAIDLGLPSPAAFDVLAHKKRTRLLDLKAAGDRAEALALIDGADVLIEGFRPGVLERLDLAPATLLARQPRLVIGRLSGWGQQGPWAQRAGHDINYLAVTGALQAIGRSDRPLPPLNLVADFGGGAMFLTVGVLAALVRRSISGRGGTVESSILAGAHGLTGFFHSLIAAGTWSLDREANLLDGGAPYYRCYATHDGRHVAVGAIEQRFYIELLKLTGLADRIDPARQHERSSWPATAARLEEAFALRPRDDWAALALQCDACVAPVLDFNEAAAYSHNRANGWFSDDILGAHEILQFTAASDGYGVTR